MTLILPTRPNAYTGSPLDRAAHLRDDAGWIAAALVAPDAVFAPVWRARSLLRGVADKAPAATFIDGTAASRLLGLEMPWAFLGLRVVDGAKLPVFTIDLSAEDDPVALLPPGSGAFHDLRMVGPGLDPDDAAVLAHARGLMHWRARYRFCHACASPLTARSAGHVLGCPNCDAQHFPRTDPAVIMLVTHSDRALLGHSQRFPRAKMYSTLAGFVEPGESLEEAVRREVLEESAIEVGRVIYHSSQPWPFPSSIMLGFYGEALTEAITIDPSELTDARWFTRAELRAPEAHGFLLPNRDSIARRLIEDWVEAG